MYAATGGPNVKWRGTDFKWGAGHHWPPAGDGPALISVAFEEQPSFNSLDTCEGKWLNKPKSQKRDPPSCETILVPLCDVH